MESNPPLYLGENISVTDNQNHDGSFSTEFLAPNTDIIVRSETTEFLSVKREANFGGIVLNNIGNGVYKTDAVNFGQVNSLITNESDRATSAEEALSKNLSTEEFRATSAEEALSKNLSTEEFRATSAEEALSKNLSTEEFRAISQEQYIQNELTSEINRATSQEQVLNQSINSEITRATYVEQMLSQNLNSEITKAKFEVENLTIKVNQLTEYINYLYLHLYKVQSPSQLLIPPTIE